MPGHVQAPLNQRLQAHSPVESNQSLLRQVESLTFACKRRKVITDPKIFCGG